MCTTTVSCVAAVCAMAVCATTCLMCNLQLHAVRAFALLDAFSIDLPPDRTWTNQQTFWY